MSDLVNSIDELMLELEDEDGDPVGGRTIAIVPGAFKPPHLGHLSMVKQYAGEADEVVVLVSSPLKASRGWRQAHHCPTIQTDLGVVACRPRAIQCSC